MILVSSFFATEIKSREGFEKFWGAIFDFSKQGGEKLIFRFSLFSENSIKTLLKITSGKVPAREIWEKAKQLLHGKSSPK